jgi:regulatory protein
MGKDPIQIALHFLKFRPRTTFEIGQKLRTKKISDSEIEKVITVLKRNKLLDDAEFAKMWVRDRNLLKPSGSYLLKLELKKLGISESDIEAALGDQNEEELARKAIESKGRYCKADFNHQAAFLSRRGFSTGVIYKILKR